MNLADNVPNDYNLHERAFCTCKMINLPEEDKAKIYSNILNIGMYKCINDIKLLMRYKTNIDIFYCMFHKYAVEMHRKTDGQVLLNHKFYIDKIPSTFQVALPHSHKCFMYCKSIDNKNYLTEYLKDENVYTTHLSMKCVLKEPLKLNPRFHRGKYHYLISFSIERNLSNSDELQIDGSLNPNDINHVTFNWFAEDIRSLPLNFSNMSIRETARIFARTNFQFESISLDFLLTATSEEMVKKSRAIINNFDKFYNTLQLDFEYFL